MKKTDFHVNSRYTTDMKLTPIIDKALLSSILILLFIGTNLWVASLSFGIVIDLSRNRTGEPNKPAVDFSQEFMDDQIFGNVVRAEIAFSQRSYEVEIPPDYNQVVPIEIFNSSPYTFLLHTEVLQKDNAVVGMNTVGVGSAFFPAYLPGEKRRTMFLKIHGQKAETKTVEGKILLVESTKREPFDQAILRVHFKKPEWKVQLVSIAANDMSMAQTITLVNQGDTLPDFSCTYFPETIQAYMNPKITHYRFQKGESLTFDLIPIVDGTKNTYTGTLQWWYRDHHADTPITFSLPKDHEYFFKDDPSLCYFDIAHHSNITQLGADIQMDIPFWYTQKVDPPTLILSMDKNQDKAPTITDTSHSTLLMKALPHEARSTDGAWIYHDWVPNDSIDLIYQPNTLQPNTPSKTVAGRSVGEASSGLTKEELEAQVSQLPDQPEDFVHQVFFKKEDQWYRTNLQKAYLEITFQPFDDVEWVLPGNLTVFVNGKRRLQEDSIRPVGTFLIPLPLHELNLPEQGVSNNTITLFYDRVNTASLAMVYQCGIWIEYQKVPMILEKPKNKHSWIVSKRNFFWNDSVSAIFTNSLMYESDKTLTFLPISLGFGTMEESFALRSNQAVAPLMETDKETSVSRQFRWQLTENWMKNDQILFSIHSTSPSKFNMLREPMTYHVTEIPSKDSSSAFEVLTKEETAYIQYLKLKRGVYNQNPTAKRLLNPMFVTLYDDTIFNGKLTGAMESVQYITSTNPASAKPTYADPSSTYPYEIEEP